MSNEELGFIIFIYLLIIGLNLMFYEGWKEDVKESKIYKYILGYNSITKFIFLFIIPVYMLFATIILLLFILMLSNLCFPWILPLLPFYFAGKYIIEWRK